MPSLRPAALAAAAVAALIASCDSARTLDQGTGIDTCAHCHGFPPALPHPPVASEATVCAVCHPSTVDSNGDIIAGGGHENGGIDVDIGSLSCTTCHGDAARASNPAAPPRGTRGETANTTRAVGAHQKHLGGGIYRNGIACGECHTVPTTMLHADGTVQLTFGTLATAEGVTPVWNGTTCTAYCHGATLQGGQNTAPTWTAGTQLACNACHGISPPTGRHQLAEHVGQRCSRCHSEVAADTATPGIIQTTAAKGLHVNAQKNVSLNVSGTWDGTLKTCTNVACHGAGVKSWYP